MRQDALRPLMTRSAWRLLSSAHCVLHIELERMASLATRLEQALSDARPSMFNSDQSYFDESTSKVVELRQQLDSKFDKDRLEAMKHLVAVC